MSQLEHPRITEVGRLLAEIDRLREALAAIFDFVDSGEDPPGRWESICAQARAALGKGAGQ